MPELLELESVVTGYGRTPVLHGVDMTIVEGDAAVILGSNGAGKTTALRAMSATVTAWAGAVRFDGHDLRSVGPERLARLGVATVPAAPGVFRDLSVVDNLRVGGFALRATRRTVEQRVERVIADFPVLAGRLDQRAGSLSGGEQRLLAIARALVGDARLLLVDEPSMGLSPVAFDMVLALLQSVHQRQVTLCVVEQSPAALDIATAAYVLELGRVVRRAAHHELDELRADAAHVYLGRGEEGP